MGFNCGIIGLPNVGKSTIFNAMTAARAHASNYPFCTIDPNIGMAVLRDKRLIRLAGIVQPEKVVPTAVEFVDIAGLVKGASKGAGLGNQFLGNIRSVETIAHIVRCFQNPDVVHVDGKVDPKADIEVVETELILADLDAVERRIEKTERLLKSGGKAATEVMQACRDILAKLEQGRPARDLMEAAGVMKDLNLLTAKPIIYVANVDEDDLDAVSVAALAVKETARSLGAGFVALCGRIEAEIAELSEGERPGFLEGLGIKESGLDRLASAAYKVLGLITFFTAGKKEVRAWTVHKGALAPQAAGVIHSDFERGFIRAEVIAYEDFVSYAGEAGCREKGLLRVEGKDYVVKDGDVMHFRFAL
ncbi:MAG: redox-regulated ATPase YchF [Deltaproteobacteria bacterium]|nr:redox-regulated ATPase YchF [Deltaproteobacteria bacterium]